MLTDNVDKIYTTVLCPGRLIILRSIFTSFSNQRSENQWLIIIIITARHTVILNGTIVYIIIQVYSKKMSKFLK